MVESPERRPGTRHLIFGEKRGVRPEESQITTRRPSGQSRIRPSGLHEKIEHVNDATAEATPIDNHVEKPVLQEKL